MTMNKKTIERYINERYDRWLDYSKYHCTLQKLEDEAVDVLNEVLLGLLSRPLESILDLYNKKKGGYTELDFYILRAIKLNTTSMTSPYLSKYRKDKQKPENGRDDNIELNQLDLIDEPYLDIDPKVEQLNRFHAIRFVFEKMDFTPWEREVFQYKFFGGENFNSEEFMLLRQLEKEASMGESLNILEEVENTQMEVIKTDIKSLYNTYNSVLFCIKKVFMHLGYTEYFYYPNSVSTPQMISINERARAFIKREGKPFKEELKRIISGGDLYD